MTSMTANAFGLTNRDYAVLLLEDVDLEAQLLAVRASLRQHAAADAALQQDIDALPERASAASGEYGLHLQNSWVDEMHGSVFQDAAHSMAAIGMLTPLIESLFVGTFRGMRHRAARDAGHSSRHPRCVRHRSQVLGSAFHVRSVARDA